MRIRLATLDDVEKISEIAEICKPYVTPMSVLYYLIYSISNIFVVEDKNVVAYLIAIKNPFTNSVLLHQMGVLPKYRKRGLASALLQHASLKFKGLKMSFLVWKFNRCALKLYRKRGYKIINPNAWFGDMIEMAV